MTNNNATTKETGMIREFEDSTEAFETAEFEAWLDKQDAENAQARQEFDTWMDGQIAEQRAFEARIDSLIHEAPNEKQTMFLWCVFLVTLTYLNSELLYSQSWY